VKAKELIPLVHGQPINQDVTFQGFSIDTRTLLPGNLFIALKGETFDGHDYLQQAKEKGAVLALVSKLQDVDIPQIIVKDTYQALGDWASYHRAQLPNIKVVAVTGSCGKTTTKQMLSAIFSQVGPTHAAQGSFNNHIGVPLTLLGLTPEHQFAVIEIGANHPNEITPLTRMAKPDVSIVTIIAPVHTEGFGSVDMIAKTKAEIFSGLNDQGVAVINADDHYYPFMQQQVKNHKVLSFSLHHADIYASDITLQYGCAGFLLHTPKGNVSIQLPILGRHNVINALAAASAAIALDVPLPLIAQGLAKMQPAKHRLHMFTGLNQARIIDDAYNANPLAVHAALDILASYPGEKVWVFFDMRELGDLANAAHEEVGLAAQEKGIDRIFAVGELSPITVAAFGEGAMHFADKASLIAALKPLLHKDMTILIKGSRSGALEEVVNALGMPQTNEVTE
jgi:UDP-N-acetylmuramoyl-tripeptide--D-alanyl-D-alanine ligase